MAFCRSACLLFLCLVQSFAVEVPVYIWGDVTKVSIKANPFAKVSTPEFSGVLKQELQEEPFTVIFIEETLSPEDFSQKINGKSSFPYLEANIADSVYLPSVEHPLRVLNKLADPEKVNHVKLTENGLSAEIEAENGRYLFINLRDAKDGESRVELLRRHNDFMEDTVSKLQERYSRVVAVYTAHNPSWTVIEHNRVRREAEAKKVKQAAVAARSYETEGLLLSANRIFAQHGATVLEFPVGVPAATEVNVTLQATKLTTENGTLVMNFRKEGGYWIFDTVTLTMDGVTSDLTPGAELYLYALSNFAYRCAQNIVFLNKRANSTDITYVYFENAKIQPFFNNNASSTLTWANDSFYCVGFFSIPIWACLFVIFILLSILFYGIMMMMDIRTMDRFDDPKGKTITISATE